MRQVNLLPEEYKKAADVRMARNSLLMVIGVPVIFLILIHFALVFHLRSLVAVANRPLAFQQDSQVGQFKEIAGLEKQIQGLIKKKRETLEVFAKHSSPAIILNTIGTAATGKVWLSEFVWDIHQSECKMRGRSFNTRLVSEFMLELKKMPSFESVELVSMGKGASHGNEEIDFQVVCKIRKIFGETLTDK